MDKRARRRLAAGTAGVLAALQLGRALLKAAAFSLLPHTLTWDLLLSLLLWGSGALALLCFVPWGTGGRTVLLPGRWGIGYPLAAVGALALFLMTPWITGAWAPEETAALFYGAAVTPLLEELLFRGWVWDRLSVLGGKAAWIGSALLFGCWHFGYWDTVLWRAMAFHPGTDIGAVLLGKAATGLVLGLILGFLRRKSGNLLAPLLLHLALNTVGT